MILKNLSYNFWDNKPMNIYKRIILFIALISFLLSCKNSSNVNVNSNNMAYGNIIFEDIIEENIVNEDIIYEDIIYEDTIYEDIIYEDITYEDIIYEIEIFEDTLNENIIPEHVIFEVSTIEDLKKNIKNKEYSDDFWGDIDWKPIISKFAVGTGVIIITGVLSIATINSPLHVVFLYSFKGALKGGLIGATSGAAVNSAMQTVLNGGKIDSWKKYALEGAADGYMYGAITGAITGAVKGVENLKKLKYTLDNAEYLKDKEGRVTQAIMKEVKIVDNARNPYAQSKFRQQNGLPDSDDAGHIFARMFGGSGNDNINYVAMSRNINRAGGRFYAVEQDILKNIESGKKVTDYTIKIDYIGKSTRPHSFNISYKVDGIIKVIRMLNI